MASFVFSSESVSEGHPDKVADQVSDAILDGLLEHDPFSRVACETFVSSGNFGCIGGEITSTGMERIDVRDIFRATLRRIGYDSEEVGFDPDAWDEQIRITEQSPDIAQGTAARADKEIGAGDQGMMFGYAQRNSAAEGAGGPAAGRERSKARDEGPQDLADPFDYMPVPIDLAHKLARRMATVRRDGTLGYLRPDGKSQVTIRYEDDVPVAVDAVVLAAQHDPDADLETLQEDLKEHVVGHVIPDDWLHDGTQYYINHTGRFVKGGPAADTGLTGRKIIVDTYGGWVPHGGGAFSGKDATKVDRSAAYYARYAAKNLVAAGVADRLQIQVAYSIGSLQPVSINVQTFGTGRLREPDIEALLRSDFSFAPGDIIEELDLRRPVFARTAAYGHFGRDDLDLPWERLDRVETLAEKLGTLA